MTRESAARFSHLHQAQHSFVQASATGGGNDDDRGAFGGSIFNRAGDSFADNRAHRGSKKPEIHDGDCDLIAVEYSVAADHGVSQASALLVILETIDRKSTRLNSSHRTISYAVFCLKKKKKKDTIIQYTIINNNINYFTSIHNL